MKGSCPNPKGRPKKGLSFPDILEKVMEENAEMFKVNGVMKPAKELLCISMLQMALDKKTPPQARLKAIIECKEWIDGKSVQKVDMAGSLEHKHTNLSDMIDINSLTTEEALALEKVLEKQIDESEETA